LEYEHFDHGADVGVRGFGTTPAEAFEGAAAALFTLLAEDLSAVRPIVEESVEIEAGSVPELLVAFLNELISLADTRRLVFSSFSIAIRGEGPSFVLSARAFGEAFDPGRHSFTVMPKGATYTALRVEQTGNRWVAQCVIDV
jgi:SHS2 domain-containing protein